MQQHHEMANQMMGNMMKGFGGGDPFANDPFFSKKGDIMEREGLGSFGMFGSMRDEMKRMMSEPIGMGMGGPVGKGQGRFVQMSR